MIAGNRVFLSLGSRAVIPDVPGAAASKPMTHIQLLDLDRLPEHLIVIGGGYVGLELSQAMRRFGSRGQGDGDRLPRQPVPGRDARDGGRDRGLLGVEVDGLHAGARLAAGRRGRRGDVPEAVVDRVTRHHQYQHKRGPHDGPGPDPSGIVRHRIRSYLHGAPRCARPASGQAR